MHQVPKIVKNSYRPLLKEAIKYNPEAIYIESPMPSDSISWDYLKSGWSDWYKNFYKLSDSLKLNFDYDEKKLNNLLEKDFEKLTESDLDFIINSFGYLRDNANYEFYNYLKKYGIKGSKSPTREEDGDLTSKLAIKIGIKRLKSIDDQQTNKEYHIAWKRCIKDGSENGDNRLNQKLNKKDYNNAIIPALFGNLGNHTNKRKSLERMHKINSCTYVENQTSNCTMAEKYWNERNKRIAQNIAFQINENSEVKNIVIIGAGHIIGIEKELKENFPEIKVILLNER